jgi:hypothetical protein
MDYSNKVRLPEFITKNTEFEFEKFGGEGEVISKGITTGYEGNEYVLYIIEDVNSKYNNCWYLEPTGVDYCGLVFYDDEWTEYTK